MQFRKSPIAIAAVALFGALPLAAHAQSGGTPYSGTPASVPAVIPAVNFDKGGEGVAYHDLSSGNLGGLYRTSEGVDIYASTDSASGPYQIANFQNGEWMNYTISVPANGNYDLSIRVSNNYGTGAFHIEVDGANVTGTISVPKTGSWNTYQWVGKLAVALTAGTHVVKLVAETQWFNVTALSVQASAGTSSTGSSGGTASSNYAGTPYTGTPVALPGSVPAVNFDKGGEGVGYHDLSSGNLGGLYRTSESVDIYASTDSTGGGYQVANFQNGEWLSYTVNVPANGNYDLGIRASNNYGTGAFHIEVDGQNVTGAISVPKTGSWDTYQWFGKQGVALAAGKHVVKVVAETQWFNVSTLSVLASSGTTTASTGTTTGSTGSTGIITTGTSTSTTTGTTTGTGSTTYAGTPYSGTAASLPVVMPAANFDKGGEGVGYHDLSSGNLGGLYRTSESVDIYASTDSTAGAYQVANFQNGEWMNYTVNVPANGNYDLGIRASNNYGTGAFHLEVDGKNVTGTVSVPKTGSWNTYQWFGKQGVALAAGKHVVKLAAEQQWFNVSALSLQSPGTGGSTTTTTASTGTSTSGSTAPSSGSTGSKPANLLFWSGFEGPLSLTTPNNCYANGCFQQLAGTDSATGASWPLTLKGGSSEFQLLVNGPYPSPDTVGQYMFNQLQSVVGHKGNQTTALYSEIRQSGCCGTNSQGGASTQDPLLWNPASEPGDIYMSKWIKLQPDLLDKLHAGDGWRAIFEWKEGVENNGQFRIQLQVVAYNGGPLTWMTKWDNLAGPVPQQQEYWRKYNTSVPVPVGEWFKFEVFWHRSTGSDGRAWFAVNGQVIDDHYGPNIGVNGTPVGRVFTNQLYSGSPYPIYQWMDDIQVWQGFPTVRSTDPWYDPPYAPH